MYFQQITIAHIKSNIAHAVLLFLFLVPLFGQASWPVRDTLILDGDTIYIEKRQRTVNLDSLQEKLNHDIIEKRVPQHRLSLAAQLGWNQTIGTFHSNYQSLAPLNNFMEKVNSRKGNLAYGLDVGYRFWDAPAKSGTVHLSGHAGLRYNEINIMSMQLDENALAHDSIIGLQYINNRLELHYFTIFDTTDMGIIGELDTAFVQTSEALTYFKTWDIPLKLRATYHLSNTPVCVFGEVGFVYRKIVAQGQTIANNYLVNHSADWDRFDKMYFRPQDIITPMFSIGMEILLGKKGIVSKHWSVNACLTSCLPSRAINPEGYFNIQTQNYVFSAALRRTF